ncbi:MAG: helix-turn-helix transcriptional regulator [Deltaproteobacteria bacterium]|nr:helix-turn-helix transcriptional regulator [Deltaproteobacteria bacterium]
MSVGKKLLKLRLQSKKTQHELGAATGMAVSYLSRLENDRIAPTVRTLSKVAGALGVPVTSFFESGAVLEETDRCPVSVSGNCILDQLFVGRGRKPKIAVEGYSPQQLEALRLCNFLLHSQDKELLRALIITLKSFLALSDCRASDNGRQASRHLPESVP